MKKKTIINYLISSTILLSLTVNGQPPPVPPMDDRSFEMDSGIDIPSANDSEVFFPESQMEAPQQMDPVPSPSMGINSPASSNSPVPTVTVPTQSGVATPSESIDIPKRREADAVPPGQELVSIHFPEPTEIKDIIRAVSLWMGKNVILDQNVRGQIQIISPRKVTKEEAYQAFLSALNLLGFTTVETGKVMKILPVRTAVRGNLRTFMGADWTPRTDEVITQIIPLKYIDAKAIQMNLAKITNSSSIIAYEPTNTLIVTDSGFKVRNILEIIKLLDVQGQQPQVSIVPIRYADAKDISQKVQEILGGGSNNRGAASGGRQYFSYKIMTDERSNSVIVFGPPRTIADVKELVKKFDIALDDASRQSTIHVRPLDYADAAKMAATLTNLMGSGGQNTARRTTRPANLASLNNAPSSSAQPSVADLGDGVKITADESSNSLLITGSRSAYQAINAIVRKLDVRKSQVFIESDILDVTLNDQFKFGMSALLGDKPGGSIDFIPVAWQADQGISGVVSGSATNSKGEALSTGGVGALAGAFAQDLSIGVLSNVDVNFAGIGKITTGALIKMIKTDANTRSLASPQILTSNNEEANITVGQTVYFTLDGDQNTTTGIPLKKTEKVTANLSLTVKPNISHSNYITMNLQIDADSIGNQAAGQAPSVNVRKSKQTVTVKNKQTIVISGLTASTEQDTINKVPLLGDIPILGWLFRNTTKAKIQSNLMIFLTPYIVHGANDLADIYATKRKSTDEFLYKVYGSRFRKSDFHKSIPTFEQGKFIEDPIDKIETDRRAQMLQEIYQARDSQEVGNVNMGSGDRGIDESRTTTVPVFSVGSDSGTYTPSSIDSFNGGGGGGIGLDGGAPIAPDLGAPMDIPPPDFGDSFD